jgi:TetR/AcrR family transcriptional repressor of nem operon
LRAVRLCGDFCEEGDGDALCRRSRRSNTPENRGKRPSPFQSTLLDEVPIDEIMFGAGLTRAGFYYQFKAMGELYAEEITSFKQCDPTERLGGEGLDYTAPMDKLMHQLVTAYLAPQHLSNTGNRCSLVALHSDVARASKAARDAYEDVLSMMAGLFECGLKDRNDSRERALALAALRVGGMTLARTAADSAFAEGTRKATLEGACQLMFIPSPATRLAKPQAG